MFSVNKTAIRDNSIGLYEKCYSKFDTKKYLTGFNYLDKVAGREVNLDEYSDVISKYGGIPREFLMVKIFRMFLNIFGISFLNHKKPYLNWASFIIGYLEYL